MDVDVIGGVAGSRFTWVYVPTPDSGSATTPNGPSREIQEQNLDIYIPSYLEKSFRISSRWIIFSPPISSDAGRGSWDIGSNGARLEADRSGLDNTISSLFALVFHAWLDPITNVKVKLNQVYEVYGAAVASRPKSDILVPREQLPWIDISQ